MLSGILSSNRAISINISIMRTFNRLRNMAASQKELGAKLSELESKVQGHDKDIRKLFENMHDMNEEPDVPQRRIGFRPDSEGPSDGGQQ